MAKSDTESALSEESAGFLEDVRKGKPRRFVLVCKGANIVSLVVYKKGSVEKYKKEAKEMGSGTVSYGVVDGKGPKINFKLARADGFEKEPTTTAKLKAFLKESADLACNPLVEIVDELGPMLDPDDPLVARFVELQAAALQACNEHPAQAAELNGLCAEIGKILDQDPSSDAAFTKIGALEKLLSGLHFSPEESRPKSEGQPKSETPAPKEGAAPTPQGEQSPPPAPPTDGEAGKFKARLTEVLKQATPLIATIGNDIKTLATEARGFAEKQNYGDANARLKQMVELIAKAKAAPAPSGDKSQTSDGKDQMAQFTVRVGELKPGLERLKTGDEAAKLKASEAAALAKQGAGLAQKNDFEQAFSLVGQAQTLIDTAVEALAKRQKQLAEAMESLRSAQRVLNAVKTEATVDLGTLPKAIAEKLAQVEKSLALEKETDSARIEKAADESGDSLTEIDTAVKKLVAEKRAYESDLLLLEGRIKALESHAQATVTFIGDKIAAIKSEVAAAKLLAGEHKFVEAKDKLLAIAGQSLETEGIADQHSQYTTSLGDRETRVTALGTATQEPVQEQINKAKRKLTQAKQYATSKNFGDAVKLLNELPKDCIDAAWLATKAGEYDAELAKQIEGVRIAKTWDPSVSEVGPYMPAVETLLEDAKYEKTNDYVQSVSLLGRVGGKLAELRKITGAFKKFRDEYRSAQAKIKAINDHKGKEGVTEQLARLRSDLTFAEARRDSHEYVTAMNVCANIVKLGDEALPIAVKCKNYLDALKTAKANIKTYDKPTAGPTVQVEVAGAKDWISKAENLATAKKWDEALAAVQQAEVRCMKAKYAEDSAKWLDDQFNDIGPELSALDTQWASAWSKYESMQTAIENGNGANYVTADIGLAKAAAAEAQTAATVDPKDFGAAQTKLVEAIQHLATASLRADLCHIYDQLRKAVTDRRAAIANPDSAFDAELQDIGDKVDNDADPEADQFHFEDAEAHLTTATEMCAALEREVKLYKDYTAKRNGNVKSKLTVLDTPAGKAAMKDEVAKFKGDVTAADDLKTQKKYKEAYDALVKAEKYGDEVYRVAVIYFEAKDAEKTLVLDILGTIKGKKLVEQEYNEIVGMQGELKKLFDAKQFVQAKAFCTTINWRIDLAQKMLAREQKYVVERDKAKNAIDGLKAVACDAIKDNIKTMESFYGKAEALAGTRNFESAMPHLATVLAGCVAPTALGKAYGLYTPALQAAEEAVAALTKDFPKSEAVALQVDDLTAKLAAAKQVAGKKAFEDAKKAVDAIPAEAAEVRKAAEAAGEFDTLSQAAAGGAKDKVDGMEAEIAKVRELLSKVQARGVGDVLKQHVTQVNRMLETAENERKANNAAKAREALKSAAAACAEANSVADQFVQIDKAIKEATSQVASMRSKYAAPALLQLTLNDLDKELLLAKSDADNSLFSSALNEIGSIRSKLVEMENLGALHAKYLDERKLVDPRVEALAKSKARYTIAKEIGEIRAYVAESQAKADERDYKEAMKLLAGAADMCDGVTLRADMHEEKEPTEDALKAILKKPDGEKQLDAIIKTLDPKAKRKVCKLALDLRFGIKLELFTDKDGNTVDSDMDKQGPDILKFYDIMQALPKTHTKDNPSLDRVQRLGDGVGTSSYNKYSRVAELRIGRATDKTERMIAQEWEMGEVDDDAKPSDNAPPTKFSWTTLHEIGHAVDDRFAVMKKNGHLAEYGGWKEYGANVSEIATAANGKFNYSESYIASYLAGDKPPPPEAPSGTDATEWERRRIEAETWCDSIRTGKKIYYSASETSRLKIDDTVYQEAYGNRWVSYSYSARKKAVAGYQFRAPGEWFAELYAAYHTGKMNKNHPARAWLSKL